MNANPELVESLRESNLYRQYERAFSDATGMPVALRPAQSAQLALHGKRHESPFCALMAKGRETCAACLRTQRNLLDAAAETPKSVTCESGLCDSAIPLRTGNQLVGFLQTGQVFRRPPTEAQFKRAAKTVAGLGVSVERDKLRKAFFSTTVVTPERHASAVSLLTLFAQHLSLVTNQILIRQKNNEPAAIARAREFIQKNQGEDISLAQAAKVANMSTFYFCKLFRKVTGVNFTNYLSRVRVETAKTLLLNPNLRISEAAYEAGFQSLTHFNRVFKKITGQSPTDYRRQLTAA